MAYIKRMQGRFFRFHHLLNAIPVFESAARLGSFTHAAGELGLTQPTVSRHIINLEEQLGVSLFTRQHNRISLTNAGRELSDAVALGLGHIDSVIRTLSSSAADDTVTIGCSFEFGSHWLMPRFSSLRRALGSNPVNVLTADWLMGMDVNSVDVLVSWGNQSWTDRPRVPLFDEIVFPACSPSLLEHRPLLQRSLEQPQLLQKAPLLYYDERDTHFMNWDKWFAHFGLTCPTHDSSYTFNSYQFMVQAMIEGEGVGLGWQQFIEPLIQSGKLVRVGAKVQQPKALYYIEYVTGHPRQQSINTVVDWFRNMADSTDD